MFTGFLNLKKEERIYYIISKFRDLKNKRKATINAKSVPQAQKAGFIIKNKIKNMNIKINEI